MYISIGIPFYNSENYLELAILSVIKQKHKFWELILIDDGSNDASLLIARKYEAMDTRIKVISDGLNRKLPYRLNELIKLAKYDFIARMDADDIMHPNRLLFQIKYLIDNNFDIVSSSYYTINRDNLIVSERCISKNKITKSDLVLGNYFICHPSVLAKKEWYESNLYDIDFDRAEDYELWFRSSINNDFNIGIMPDLLMFYREDGSFSKEKQIKTYYTTYFILKKYRKYLSLREYLIGISRNFVKKFFIKFLLNNFTERLLLQRRNKFNISENSDYSESQLILNEIVYSKK